MVKTYITMISLQGTGGLIKTFYSPQGFELKNNRETSFPIIPVIADDHQPGEDIKVLAVRTDNTDTVDNYSAFLEELKEIGIQENQVTELRISEMQDDTERLKMLLMILDAIPDDALIRTDITFGTKPMSALLLYAMSFIEKLKDVEVEGIYYGEIVRRQGKQVQGGAMLHELTVFKLLGETIEQLEALEFENPQEVLRRMLNL